MKNKNRYQRCYLNLTQIYSQLSQTFEKVKKNIITYHTEKNKKKCQSVSQKYYLNLNPNILETFSTI